MDNSYPQFIIDWYTKDKIKAVDAKFEAQKIAFGPYIFQAARSLKNLGILQLLFDAKDKGLTLEDLKNKTGMKDYGLKVLLEMGLSSNIVKLSSADEPWCYTLGKVGFFLLHDGMTIANSDFTNDVCYEGAFALEESIKNEKPEGLKVFGDWNTVYEGLSSLEPHVQKSWFAFDHFYSDAAFKDALEFVFKNPKKKLMDIGGNTAKWALSCFNHNSDVNVTIIDLPGQAAMARKRIEQAGASERIEVVEANMLDKSSTLPKGHDAVWMSQFLDCFSLDEVTDILSKVYNSVDENCDVFVMEPLWDRQKYPAAVFSLHATSLYFTNIANGNSKMYAAQELVDAISKAGFYLKDEINELGPNDYSILVFRKKAD